MALRASAPAPGRPVESRSQLFPRVLRSGVLPFRALARTESLVVVAAKALMVGIVAPGRCNRDSHGGRPGGGTLPCTLLLPVGNGRTGGADLRLEPFAGCGVSLAFPVIDDSDPGHHLQPNHLPAAVAGVEGGGRNTTRAGSSGVAGRQYNSAAVHGPGGGRSLQWHSLPDVTGNIGGDLRISSRAAEFHSRRARAGLHPHRSAGQ